MQLYSPFLKSLKALAIVMVGAIALSSCSSSQNIYDEDGIYSNPNSETTAQAAEDTGVTGSGVAYKNYFEEKAAAYEEIPEEGAVFTDIESYTSTDGDLQEEYVEDYAEGTGYRAGNAAWGDEVGSTEVNIYNNGFGGGLWGAGWGGWGFNRWGYNRFGWGGPWGGWGYYDPFFGPFNNGWGYGGFGFGYAAYWNPFCYGYARPFNNRPFNNNAYHNGYGRNNGIAYGRGRRNSASSAIAASRTRLRESGRRTARSRSVYSRSRGTARPSNARGNARPRSNSARPSRPNASRPATGARPSRPSASRPSGTRPNASRPSTSRPRGNARPSSSRPSSRPSYSRPSSSRPSYSRPSSSSRGSSARSSSSRSSSRSSGSRGSSRSGGRRG